MPNSAYTSKHLPLGLYAPDTRDGSTGEQRPNEHDEARIVPLQYAPDDQIRRRRR